MRRDQNQEFTEKLILTQQLSDTILKIQPMFGDLEPLISKNLTPNGFWFLIDTLYFHSVEEQSLREKYKKFIENNKVNFEQFSTIQQQQFILKMRKLISNEKGTLNIQDITSTPLDEVIQIAEEYCERLNYQNNCEISLIQQQIKKQNMELEMILSKMNKKPRKSHPMFVYEELEEEICEQLIKDQKKKKKLQKCYICSLPNKLIFCNTCNLKVHKSCYPTFPFNNSKNASPEQLKRREEMYKNFKCENCRNQIDQENQICCLCCCIGVSFLKTCQYETNRVVSIDENQNSLLNLKTTQLSFHLTEREKKKSKFVHVSCFIWNSELKWNPILMMAEGVSNIDKKKINGMCSLCGVAYGAAVPCSNESCRRFYHAECARRNNLQMNIIRAKTSIIIDLYCQRHRHLKNYESIYEKNGNKIQEVRKLFEGIDKQIKRQHSLSAFHQVKNNSEKDCCIVCGMRSFQNIIECKQCRKWYHRSCSTYCHNCQTAM